ncbi:Leguminosin group485 secreted peptide [Trema orientale]|uniref:Leguminosin group485 secreted peptide n=1 Tax=Trema orientale TaxID=63057 RepID=A0A2P5FZQ0_TREOI|nr:Leguminosin group485 secreted peptide [Trema orientale]
MALSFTFIFLSLIILFSSLADARFLAEKSESKQGNGNMGRTSSNDHAKEVISGLGKLVVEPNSKDKKEFCEMKDLSPIPGIPTIPGIPFPPSIPGFPPLPDVPVFNPPFGNIPGIPPLPSIPNLPPLPPLPTIPFPFLSPPPA